MRGNCQPKWGAEYGDICTEGHQRYRSLIEEQMRTGLQHFYCYGANFTVS